jgi:hypothetical protein
MDQGNYTYWQPSAPEPGAPWLSSAPPFGVMDDPLGAASTQQSPVITVQPTGSPVPGYAPSWGFIMPWGVGDAPQHPWGTRWLAPMDNRGPGDNTTTFFRTFTPPIIQNFAMRWQGMAVNGGNLLMTGLYTPAPLDAMTAAIYGPGG